MKILTLLSLLFGTARLSAQDVPLQLRTLIDGPRQTLREQADQALSAGRTAEAITSYEAWLRAAPTDAEGSYQLARAYAAAGRASDASLALELALANGLQDLMRIATDPALEPLTRKPGALQRAWQQRQRIDSTQSVLYTRQARIGRSLVTYPPGYTPTKKYRLGILLHGNGNTEGMMSQWARQLGIKDIIWVAPQAPYVKLRESMASMREKYSAAGEGLQAPDTLMDDIVDASATWYHEVLRDARTRLPISLEKPIVIGFSQGGFYAHVLATRFPADVGRIVSISASMYAAGKVTSNYGAMRKYGVTALVLHGTKDDVVPLQTAELIHSMMENAGVTHNYKTFDGAHWPTAEADAMIREFLRP